MKIKKGDKIIVTTGKDKGKTGSIVKALPKTSQVVIDGVNVKKVHIRARKQGEKGKIIEKAMPIHVSNVKKS
jgi:large subunit ribosomal protein L24